ncbi:MAG: LysR family transcriptional regulator [Clostridia bacterium]|nr:LysR family transcriptional regulator [Clostridia bacterium]
MDIKQLECFVSLANTLNFTKSSTLMYISQPAFSRHITKLEEELGTVLFHRDKRSVTLTPFGEVFLEEAEKMIMHYNNGITLAKQAESGLFGSLKIGFHNFTLDEFLPSLITSFRSSFPNIGLILNGYSHSELSEAIRNGKVDFVYTASNELPRISGITSKIIAKHSFCAVMHQDHPLAANTRINAADLKNEPFILMDRKESAQGHNINMQICLNHGFSPLVVSYARFVTTVLVLIDCKVGISILPNSFKNLASPRIRFVPLENIDSFREIVAWKKDNPNPCMPYFIDELQKVLHSSHGMAL